MEAARSQLDHVIALDAPPPHAPAREVLELFVLCTEPMIAPFVHVAGDPKMPGDHAEDAEEPAAAEALPEPRLIGGGAATRRGAAIGPSRLAPRHESGAPRIWAVDLLCGGDGGLCYALGHGLCKLLGEKAPGARRSQHGLAAIRGATGEGSMEKLHLHVLPHAGEAETVAAALDLEDMGGVGVFHADGAVLLRGVVDSGLG